MNPFPKTGHFKFHQTKDFPIKVKAARLQYLSENENKNSHCINTTQTSNATKGMFLLLPIRHKQGRFQYYQSK